MELNPEYIKENLSQIGIKEAITLLKEWINSSSCLYLRKEALETLGSIDNGKNFNLFEQLFLSDESLEIRLISGKILRENYYSNKKIEPLLKYTLNKVDNIKQKILAVKILSSIDKPSSLIILKEYLKKFIETKFKDKIIEFSSEVFSPQNKASIPKSIIDTSINIILNDYYVNKCGYNVTIRNGTLILLNCEGFGLTSPSKIVEFKRVIDIEHLLLQRNNIERINGLEHLKKLRILNLSNNNIKKIENLQSLINLEELILSNNKIEKIENLNSLKNLKKLSLEFNSIKRIERLDNLNNLEELDLSNNHVLEIKNLDKLRKLKKLNLSFNEIEKISGLQKLTGLTKLQLNDNKIHLIKGLDSLKSLKGLNLSNNKIERIKNLENLTSLKKIELSNNRIPKMEGLNNLVNIQELFLDRNYIKELEGMENLNSLIILFLEKNEISEYKNLDDLKNLNFVFLNDNPLTKESWKLYEKKTKFP